MMNASLLMIIDNTNYYQCLVTILSVFQNNQTREKIRIFFVEGTLAKERKKELKQFLASKAHVRFIKAKNIHSEKDIIKLDLRLLHTTDCEKVLYFQSNTMIRKDLKYLLDKYNGSITAGKNIIRTIEESSSDIIPYDFGFIIIDLNAISNTMYTIEMAIRKKSINIMSIEDYFYIHPMISLYEVNSYFKTNYTNLDIWEENAAVVKLFSSIETRLREKTIFSREWVSYLKEIPNGYEKAIGNSCLSQFGPISRIRTDSETSYYWKRILIISKKYIDSNYTVSILGIPFFRYKESEFYSTSYFLFFRIRKKINWGYIDAIFSSCINDIAAEINKINVRLNENYELKKERNKIYEKLDSEKLLEEVNDLELYNLFKEINSNNVIRENEIRLKSVCKNGEEI